MTRVVATAFGETPDELYDAVRRADASPADIVEVRLDAPSGLPWDLRPYFAHAKPTIATVRHADDGGRSHADDETRAAILRRALRGGAKGIDVELESAEAKALVEEARGVGALVVVSAHLASTPDAPRILSVLRAQRALGATIAKVATRVESPADGVALLEAARLARDEGIPFALMAVNDPFLRLLAPTLGMALAYGAVPGMAAAAPGQVAVDALAAAHRALAPRESGRTRAAFLLGHPVAHSRSPAMMNAAFAATGVDARYLALDVAPPNLDAAFAGLRAANALGCNVTIPHKEAALRFVDEVDASARAVGAANVVVARDGRLVAHNTDGAGAMDALREAAVQPRRALVLGAGGAAKAVVHALREAGAEVLVANRTPSRAEGLGDPVVRWEQIGEALPTVDLLVNATSVGLHGESLAIPIERLPAGAAVLDCVVGETPLVRDARARGLRVVRGDAMLLHQGARAFTLWTGKRAPIDAMRAALEASP